MRALALPIARLVFVGLVGILGACPRPPAAPPPARDDGAAYLAIAGAELQRGAGVAALVELAGHADAVVRAAALRGLGRVGDAAAVAALRAAVTGRRDAVAAATALGLAGALERIAPADAPAITAELTALAGEVADPAVVAALGRAGDASALPALAAAMLDDDAARAAAAGLALGRLGRRGIALDDGAVAAAIARAADPVRDVRYGAIYALARGHVAPSAGAGADEAAPRADAAAAALVGALADADAEIRALALLGLGRRGARAAGGGRVTAALLDPDWRVAAEAVRLVAGPGASDADLEAVAVAAVRAWTQVIRDGARSPRIHVVLEALRALVPHAASPATRALAAIDQMDAMDVDPRHLAHVRALRLAAAARVATSDGQRDAALDAILALDPLLPGARAALVAESAAARAAEPGGAAFAGEVLLALTEDDGHASAGLTQLAAAWASLEAPHRARAIAAIGRGLDARPADVVGGAAEAAAAVLPQLTAAAAAEAATWRQALVAAIVGRARVGATDPELLSTLLGAIEGAALAEGLAACTAALAADSAAVRQAARACVQALGQPDPGPGEARALAVPASLDPAPLLGAGVHVTWLVATTRGEVRIALDPRRAPWTVASLVALTRAGAYDGLPFHRVVPGFVVQGGDPEGTGWGGPGYTLPAEPSDAPYAAGAVGIADAGADTGGSQWFVMHAAAPHLDGRYTQVGEVLAGQDVMDALVIGDEVVAARVEVTTGP